MVTILRLAKVGQISLPSKAIFIIYTHHYQLLEILIIVITDLNTLSNKVFSIK